MESKAEEIFARHWRARTGKELDPATKAHMQYAIDAIDEALVCQVKHILPDRELALKQTQSDIINQLEKSDKKIAEGHRMGFIDCYDWIERVTKLKEHREKAKKEDKCLCLHEIENNLPRTKFCFIPCEAQRNELHERRLAIERKYPVSKVIYFDLKDGKYICTNGEEVTTEMMMKYEHAIFNDGGYLILSKNV